MITTSNTYPDGSSSVTLSSSQANSASNPPPSDNTDSFDDVLQQQGGGAHASKTGKGSAASSSDKTAAPAKPATTSSKTNQKPVTADDTTSDENATLESETPVSTAATSTVTAATATPAAKANPTPVFAGSALSAMIVQASVLASSTQKPTGPSTTTATNTTAKSTGSGTTAKNSTPTTAAYSDLSTLLAQALILAGGAQKTAVAAVPASTAKASSTTADTGTAKGKSASTSTTASATASPDLATLIAQASILGGGATVTAATAPITQSTAATATNATVAATTQGNELPLSVASTIAAGSSSKEKKSASTSGEGSFLQSGTGASTTAASALSSLEALLGLSSNAIGSQQVAAISGTANSSANTLSTGGSAVAGIANVEKGKAMNADINFPELEVLSGYGADTTSAANQSAPDAHILLSSNNEFTNALQQVMHIASLTETTSAHTPMRVAIEIQTPPGAVVNVYVSKQADNTYRAQLSTNDPQALSWVQDQMSSLKSTDMGVTVRWLPPQIESSSTLATATSNGGQDTNLGWDRGGQGQANYQQDERSQSERQKRAGVTPDVDSLSSNPFMTTLTEFGRAA